MIAVMLKLLIRDTELKLLIGQHEITAIFSYV